MVAFCFPLVAVWLSWGDISSDLWRHLTQTVLWESTRNTLFLALAVVPAAAMLGTTLAFFCQFVAIPRWLVWLLILPLTFPKYVLGFLYLSLLDYAGPVQTAVRPLGVDLSSFLQTGQLFPVAVVMTLALYPYVFLSVREALKSLDPDYLAAAQAMGAGPWKVLGSICLPQTVPWIAAGSFLVLMECLSDFGTVAIFNYDTYTTTLYETWFGLFSFATAGQLATLVALLAVFLLYFMQRLQRHSYRYSSDVFAARGSTPMPLPRGFLWGGGSIVTLTILLGLLIPLLRLVWLQYNREIGNWDVLDPLWHTLIIATAVGVACLLIVYLFRLFAMVCGDRPWLTRAPQLGYSMPGIIVAIGILLMLEKLPFLQFLQGTLMLSCLALSLRFYALAFANVTTGLARIPSRLGEAAQLMGASPWQILKDIYRPYLIRASLVALLFVMIDTAKEMPITLMTRTFGFDTLAIKVFEYTSEGRFDSAAFPALCLTAFGLVPVIAYSLLADHKNATPQPTPYN